MDTKTDPRSNPRGVLNMMYRLLTASALAAMLAVLSPAQTYGDDDDECCRPRSHHGHFQHASCCAPSCAAPCAVQCAAPCGASCQAPCNACAPSPTCCAPQAMSC